MKRNKEFRRVLREVGENVHDVGDAIWSCDKTSDNLRKLAEALRINAEALETLAKIKN